MLRAVLSDDWGLIFYRDAGLAFFSNTSHKTIIQMLPHYCRTSAYNDSRPPCLVFFKKSVVFFIRASISGTRNERKHAHSLSRFLQGNASDRTKKTSFRIPSINYDNNSELTGLQRKFIISTSTISIHFRR